MIEAENDCASKKASDQNKNGHEKQHYSETHPRSAAARSAANLGQHQDQQRTNYGTGPKPPMSGHDPGRIAEAKLSPKPTEDARDDRGQGAEPDAKSRN